MVEPGDGDDLAVKEARGGRVGQELGADRLDGDVALLVHVVAAKDLAHTAPAEERPGPIAIGDERPDGERHRGILLDRRRHTSQEQRERTSRRKHRCEEGPAGDSGEEGVPFALWCAARHLDDYAETLWGIHHLIMAAERV